MTQNLLRMDHRDGLRQNILISLLLAAITIAVYWPAKQCEFTNFDDPFYVTDNYWVTGGLTWENFKWAFTTRHAANWHPLTWLSHMLDVTCYGLKPAGHHLTNVAFHVANTVLLFVLLRCMTGATWRSATVAALFALHPLHVESVAWLSERKDVLSTFFGLLTLWAYTRHVQRQKRTVSLATGSNSRFMFHVSIPYCLAVLFFALGLMAKPMLVTWPFLMLLLDYWPLERIGFPFWQNQWKELVGLVVEKIPFFLVVIGSCIITCIAQTHAMQHLAMAVRIQNATLSYGSYLQNMIWPTGLAAFYPYPDPVPQDAVAVAALFLLVVSILSFVWIRSRPCLFTGWFWYLGTLVPVIGFLQVGNQAMADRYTYFPLIGIFIAIVWTVSELTQRFSRRRAILAAAAATVLIVCATLTRAQLGYWKNSETLFRHTVAVTRNNSGAMICLAWGLMAQNKEEEANKLFEEAYRINPNWTITQVDMGRLLMRRKQIKEAIPILRRAVEIDPSSPRFHNELGNALEMDSQREEAISEFRKTLAIDPNSKATLNDLAWILATGTDERLRNGADAVRFAEDACRLTRYEKPLFIGTLAAAYAEAGRFDDAVATAERARQLALAKDQKHLAQRNAELAELYRAHKAYRELTNSPAVEKKDK